MSHFSVLVIGPKDKVEGQLAPFMENCCGTPDKAFMEFYDTQTEYEEKWEKNEAQECIATPDGKYHYPWDASFQTEIKTRPRPYESDEEAAEAKRKHKFWMEKKALLDLAQEKDEHATIRAKNSEGVTGDIFGIREDFMALKVSSLPENAEFVQIPLKKLYADFDTYVQEYHGAESKDSDMNRYGYWQNPNAKWDWYQIGGRWTGYFKLKPEGDGSLGEKSWASAPPKTGTADQARKDDIDFEGMRMEKAIFAHSEYSIFEEHVDTTRRFAHWDDVREWCMGEGKFAKHPTALLEEQEERPTFVTGAIDFSKPAPKTLSIDEDGECKKLDKPIDIARHLYHSQPWMEDRKRVKAIAREMSEKGVNTDAYEWTTWGSMENFDCTREEYVQRARDNAISTFAVVKDGEWMEQGSMGWWGMVSDEKDQKDWNGQFNEALDALPGHTTLTIVDCHI